MAAGMGARAEACGVRPGCTRMELALEKCRRDWAVQGKWSVLGVASVVLAASGEGLVGVQTWVIVSRGFWVNSA